MGRPLSKLSETSYSNVASAPWVCLGYTVGISRNETDDIIIQYLELHSKRDAFSISGSPSLFPHARSRLLRNRL